MTLLDQRGRLFGRLNLVDAGVAALLVGAAAVAFTGFRVFRMPRGPEIAALEPATQPAARGAHLTVRGRDFLPFLRVFVRRSEEAGLVHPDEKPADDYTLVNHTQAKWAVESPSLATVQLPDDVAPGTYDLMFYVETRLLTIRGAAFRLSPPPASATSPPSLRCPSRTPHSCCRTTDPERCAAPWPTVGRWRTSSSTASKP